MSINLTDEIEVKTKKGKLCAAKQIFLKGDMQTVEKEIQDINSRHNTLNTKHESLSRTVQGIAATGGANTATNVTYNNDSSGLNAENAQDAIDELENKKFDKESILQKSGEAEDKVMSQKATTTAIANEVARAKAAEEAIIFDVSANNNGEVFESLSALLNSSNLSTLIPRSVRYGGMTIRFIQGSEQGSDNKYVQYRLMSTVWSYNFANWQGVDDEPTAGSDNLVKSGGIYSLNNKHTIYNVNSALNTINTYYTLSTAITAVPVSERRSGIVLLYRKNYNTWEYAQLNTVYTENTWNTIENWTIINAELASLVANHTTKIEALNNKFGVYDLNKAINTPSTYYTLEEAIAAVPEEDRKVNMILSFRSSKSTVDFAQYTIGSVDTNYFTDVSNWHFWSNIIRNNITSIADINSSLIDKAENKDTDYDYSELASHDTVYRINSASEPTTIDLTGIKSSTYFGVKIPVKAGDVVSLYGRGGTDRIRLWAISDDSGNLIDYCKDSIQRYSEADRWDINSGPLTLVIPTNGKFFLFNSSVVPFRVMRFRQVSSSIFDKQQTWLALGDSITNGTTSKFTNEEETAATTETADNLSYAYFVSKLKKCRMLNWGIGGMGYLCPSTNSTYPYNMKQLIDKITDISDPLYRNLNSFDCVTIALGINDYKGSYNLGSMDDVVDSGTSVIANMRYTIEKIIETNPNIKIFVITPMNARGYGYTLGNYSTNYAIGYSVNGKTLQDFCDAMIQVCNYYGIQYINQTNYSVVNRINIVKALPDGVHPSKDIQKQIAKELAEKITFDMNWI